MHIAVIGAGIVGASAAFHLARAGVSVTVVDARLDGRATAAGAGIICPWVSGIPDQPFYRLYVAGGEYYPELVAALAEAGQTDLGYRRSGAMLVAGDREELDWLERSTRQRQAPMMGDVTRLSPTEAQTLFPALDPALGAIHIAGGARVDGRRIAASLRCAAEARGTRFIEGHASVAFENDRAIGVDVGAERVATDHVIVTAGAWTTELVGSVPVEPQRGQIVHLQLQGIETADWPVVLPPGSHYIVPFDGGRVVVGATREAGSGFDYRVTALGQAEVLFEALRIAPGLGSATLLETRIGFRPASTLGRPALGWVPGTEGLAVATGLGPAGLTIGPLAGRVVADLVLRQEPPIDLMPFDPARHPEATRAEVPPLR